MSEMICSPCKSAFVALRLALSLSAMGCIGPFAPCGSDVGSFGLDIGVIDVRTSGPPTAEIVVVVSDGDYSETVRSGPPTGRAIRLGAAPERPGNYTVSVSAVGYQPQSFSNLTVRRSGRCDYLQTVSIDVRLQPAP